MTDAGRTLMPAFDKLANTLIGDNPALTQALRYLASLSGIGLIFKALQWIHLTDFNCGRILQRTGCIFVDDDMGKVHV